MVVKKVGLLGTKYAVSKDFYKKGLLKYGIKTIVLDDADMDYINNVIFNELVYGVIKDESKKSFIKIINKLKEEGTRGVILECTEIPLLIKESDIDIKVFDSTKIHAYKALEFSLTG